MYESHPDLSALADVFWSWRAHTQPLSGDGIPRIERPPGWTPDWSPDAIEQQRRQLSAFEADWRALAADTQTWSEVLRIAGCLEGT